MSLIRRLMIVVIAVASLPVTQSLAAEDAMAPLPAAHAHNDYLHDRPLLDALDNGFCSVEADIFLVDGKLLVAHTRRELSADHSLERLYLDPLRQRIRNNGGRVHRNGPVFTLMIDIKSDGVATYKALHDVLRQYHEIFTRVENGTVHQKAVVAIVSGNRPQATIAAHSPRYVGIDGRLSDLDSDQPTHLLPLISDNWRNHFQWRGEGKISEAERMKLQDIVQQAHSKKRRLRFWATPDTPAMWGTLQAAGVDLINTDNLPGLSEFLRNPR